MESMRIVIGISGASGAPIALELLRQTKAMPQVETCLVMTDSALHTLRKETEYTSEQVMALADQTFGNGEIGAPPASGSWKAEVAGAGAPGVPLGCHPPAQPL